MFSKHQALYKAPERRSIRIRNKELKKQKREYAAYRKLIGGAEPDSESNIITYTDQGIGIRTPVGVSVGVQNMYWADGNSQKGSGPDSRQWQIVKPHQNSDFYDPRHMRVITSCTFKLKDGSYLHDGHWAPICGLPETGWDNIEYKLDSTIMGGRNSNALMDERYFVNLFSRQHYSSDFFNTQLKNPLKYLGGWLYSSPDGFRALDYDTAYGHRLGLNSRHNYPTSAEPLAGTRLKANGDSAYGDTSKNIDAGAAKRREFVNTFQRKNKNVEYVSKPFFPPFDSEDINHKLLPANISQTLTLTSHGQENGWYVKSRDTTVASKKSRDVTYKVTNIKLFFVMKGLTPEITKFLNAKIHFEGEACEYVGVDRRTNKEVFESGKDSYLSHPIANFSVPQRVIFAFMPNTRYNKRSDPGIDPFEYTFPPNMKYVQFLKNGNPVTPTQYTTHHIYRQTAKSLNKEYSEMMYNHDEQGNGYAFFVVETSLDSINNQYLLQKNHTGTVQMKMELDGELADNWKLIISCERRNKWEVNPLQPAHMVINPI